jgi:LAO/AO transport system kinase
MSPGWHATVAWAEVALAARAHQRRAVAKLVTTFEDPRPDAAAIRREVIATLDGAGAEVGRVIGITGAPGAGKSSLIGALAHALIARPAGALAVVAVDPSSPISGGAFLGDRTRVRFPPDEPRLYFRSQPSRGALGGLAPSTFQVCRLLARLYDTVVVETVGVGQSEIAVAAIADATFLVIAPHGGDEVQFMKAGIMEVPDGFVLSKDDLGAGAERAHAQLRGALRLSGNAARPIVRTSATRGAGIATLLDAMAAVAPGGLAAREPAQFAGWVEEEHGRSGLNRLAEAGGAAAYVAAAGGFDAAQLAFA